MGHNWTDNWADNGEIATELINIVISKKLTINVKFFGLSVQSVGSELSPSYEGQYQVNQ